MVLYSSDKINSEVDKTLKDKVLNTIEGSYEKACQNHETRHITIVLVKDYFNMAYDLINTFDENCFSGDFAGDLAKDLFTDMDLVVEKIIKDNSDKYCMYGLRVIDGRVNTNVADDDVASTMWGVCGEKELASDSIKTHFDGEKLELIPTADDEAGNSIAVTIDRDDNGTFSAHLVKRNGDFASDAPALDLYDNDEIYFAGMALMRTSKFISEQYQKENMD